MMYGGGAGGIRGDLGRLYVSPRQLQLGRNFYSRGGGFGDVFRGVFNFLSPLLRSGTKAIGRELLSGSAEVLEGLSKNQPLSSLMQQQKEKRIKNLTQMAREKINNLQSGSGFLTIRKPKGIGKQLTLGSLVGPAGSRAVSFKRVVKSKPKKTVKVTKKLSNKRNKKEKKVVKPRKKVKRSKRKSTSSKRNKIINDIFSSHNV